MRANTLRRTDSSRCSYNVEIQSSAESDQAPDVLHVVELIRDQLHAKGRQSHFLVHAYLTRSKPSNKLDGASSATNSLAPGAPDSRSDEVIGDTRITGTPRSSTSSTSLIPVPQRDQGEFIGAVHAGTRDHPLIEPLVGRLTAPLAEMRWHQQRGSIGRTTNCLLVAIHPTEASRDDGGPNKPRISSSARRTASSFGGERARRPTAGCCMAPSLAHSPRR